MSGRPPPAGPVSEASSLNKPRPSASGSPPRTRTETVTKAGKAPAPQPPSLRTRGASVAAGFVEGLKGKATNPLGLNSRGAAQEVSLANAMRRGSLSGQWADAKQTVLNQISFGQESSEERGQRRERASIIARERENNPYDSGQSQNASDSSTQASFLASASQVLHNVKRASTASGDPSSVALNVAGAAADGVQAGAEFRRAAAHEADAEKLQNMADATRDLEKSKGEEIFGSGDLALASAAEAKEARKRGSAKAKDAVVGSLSTAGLLPGPSETDRKLGGSTRGIAHYDLANFAAGEAQAETGGAAVDAKHDAMLGKSTGELRKIQAEAFIRRNAEREGVREPAPEREGVRESAPERQRAQEPRANRRRNAEREGVRESAPERQRAQEPRAQRPLGKIRSGPLASGN